MRVTTSMMMRNYTTRLSNTLSSLNIANQKAITQRKFLSAAESPGDAAKAYQLRRQYQKTESHLSSAKDIQDTMDSLEGGMMEINSMANSAYDTILEAGGTMDATNRGILADKIDQMQKSMLMSANAQFQGRFLYGGTSVDELPFKLENGVLTYRGLDVNDPANTAKLEELSKEAIYSDLGFGLEVKLDANGDRIVTPGSAFNTAVPGIKFLGFGQDADGNSKNLILTLSDISAALRKEPYDSEALDDIAKRLDDQKNNLMSSVTKLGSDSNFLKTTTKRLSDNLYNLNSKMINVELEDPALLIMNLKELDYTYKMSLQIGMNILSPSFIDFMK